VPVISVDHVWKHFRRPHERATTLKQALLAHVRGRSGYDEFWAVRDVSFTLDKGQTVALVGANGSGKSTLLSLIAKVLRPTRGTLSVEGQVVPLLALGAGFNMELSGRDNVYLNAMLLGLNRRQIRSRYQQIVDFAELPDFMEAPVKTYSSGMFLRLAFSIAVHTDPDVLILDEVLSVGDERFRARSLQRMEDIRRSGATVITVTHTMSTIKDVCERAIWLRGGEAILDGEPTEVAAAYLAWLRSLDAAVKPAG